MDNAKEAALVSRIREELKAARTMVERVKSDGREPTPDEKARIEHRLNEANRLKEDLDRERHASRKANDVRRLAGERDGWSLLAKSLADGQTRFKGRLADFMAKAISASDVSDNAASRRPGVGELLEDLRNAYAAFPRQDTGNALSVEEFRITDRGLAAGSAAVLRDPLATTPKAEVDLTIELESVDFKQVAAMVSGIPLALNDAEPALDAALRSSLRRELDKALDVHAMTQLDAAASLVSGGSGLAARVRRAMSDIRDNGGSANVAIVSEADLEALDLLTEANSIPNWPFGLRIFTHPELSSGEGYVFDSSGAILYSEDIDFASDPYAGRDGDNFQRNLVDVRAEGKALLHVREPGKFVKLDESQIVT